MQELTSKNNTLVSVSELANMLDVNKSTITRSISKLDAELHPLLTNSQGGYLLNENQCTLIKQEIQSHHNLASRQIDSVTTEQEETEIIIQAMSILKRKHDEYKLRAEIAEHKLIEQQPKIEFYDDIIDSKDLISMGKVAKLIGYGIGRNKLFQVLRNRGILMQNNVPYQTYITRGYFELKESTYTTNSGDVNVIQTTLVTQKGLTYIKKVMEFSA